MEMGEWLEGEGEGGREELPPRPPNGLSKVNKLPIELV